MNQCALRPLWTKVSENLIELRPSPIEGGILFLVEVVALYREVGGMGWQGGGSRGRDWVGSVILHFLVQGGFGHFQVTFAMGQTQLLTKIWWENFSPPSQSLLSYFEGFTNASAQLQSPSLGVLLALLVSPLMKI